jgi:Ni,Fe-hydrogenase III large subunit/Ni,Fe-hydrogenase III component G
MTTLELESRTCAEDVQRAMAAALGPLLRNTDRPRPDRLYFTVDPGAAVKAVEVLYSALGARYVISVGVDLRQQLQGFEVLHCLAFDGAHLRCAVRVPLDAAEPRLPSITPLIPGAAWAEQEMWDMLGIRSDGHPKPRRLVLPDGFPKDQHPLRKDFPYNFQPPSDPTAVFEFDKAPPGTTTVQIGTFFPVLEEPSQWRLFVDGESVVGADYRGFYCHRAVEKLADSVLTYNQVISLAERICGICGCVHSTTYCQAVEEAAGLEVPLRALVIRTLILEIERLQSHLLWLGLACHIVGFDYVFMQAWRLREPLMSLAEYLSGSRKHFASNLVGGTAFDVVAGQHPRVLDALTTVERETMTMVAALQGDEALVSRLRDVGVMTAAEARAMGAVGPTARASGLAMDVRKDHPYAAYAHMQFDVVTQDSNDVWGRTLVRVLEIFESVRIARQCVAMLADLPEGGIMADVPAELPAFREGVSGLEAPRGEVFHYVLTGDRNGPHRWRVRAPSYQNLQAVPVMFKPGTTVADVPITLGSVDPCFSCTERMETLDVGTGASRTWAGDELTELCRRDLRARRARAARRPAGS